VHSVKIHEYNSLCRKTEIYQRRYNISFQVFGNRILGVMKYIIPVGVALSTFGCALSGQFAVARLCYVASREGHMLKAFSYIHVRRLTPAPAVILQVSDTALR
jgi:amino acid transporter